VFTERFVDTHHPTAANGKCPALPSRTLLTTIWYPATARSSAASPQPGATPARSAGPYPLIVFAHGFSANPGLYAALLSRWAAAGYVVAAPLFPLSGSASLCGPVAGDTANQPSDLSYVITSLLQLSSSGKSPLAGLVNPGEIGAAGHSEGAITALGVATNTCCRDDRVKAALILAGTAQNYPDGRYDFNQAPPILFIHGTNDSLIPYLDGVGTFNRARGPKGLLTIDKGEHGSAAGLGSAPALAAVGQASTDFFAAYLRGDTAALKRLPADSSPGVAAMRFITAAGSTETIPTPAAPKLHLQASASATDGLVDGQTVIITWSGFSAGKTINILQCTPSDRDLSNSAGCDYTHALLLKPDPTGSGSLPLHIAEGKVGNGTCDATHAGCFILVNNASSTDPANSVFIPITFKP
jgi:fermentation-respiration switch protein FrsA (DUF1100 family)